VPRPKPVTVTVVCSECGLDWNLHKPDAKGNVALDECVRLLKLEVSKPRPVTLPIVQPMPYPVYPPINPFPVRPYRPAYPPYRPTWITQPNTITGSGSGQAWGNATSGWAH